MYDFCFVQKKLIGCLECISSVQSEIQIGVGEVRLGRFVTSFFHSFKRFTTGCVPYVHNVKLEIVGVVNKGSEVVIIKYRMGRRSHLIVRWGRSDGLYKIFLGLKVVIRGDHDQVGYLIC